MTRKSYPDYRRSCGWNALLPARRPQAMPRGDQRRDLVVIGAGYTGLAAARRAAELAPEAAIAVLDASEAGEGNPGRNSGFLLEIALANDADPSSMERMQRCNALVAGAMQQLRELVERHDIRCDLARAGTYRAAASSKGARALENYRAFLDAAGLPYEMLDSAALHRRLGTPYYATGLYSPHCYLAQPAALARGLAEHLPDSVELYENSPAVSIAPRNGKWVVGTPHGNISAARVIVANNAFCKQLGIGRSRIVAMYTYAALTAPLPEAILEHVGSDRLWGLLPAHRLGSTLRRTRDGRILIRSFYGYEKEARNSRIADRLLQSLRLRFPQLGDTSFASVWAGATGFTFNGAPLWGRYAPGLYVSAGCNGGGVVKGTLFGGLLADLAWDQPVPDIAALFGTASWMPPEPLRSLGFSIQSKLERFRARAEM